MTKRQEEDLRYRMREVDNYLARKESNLMSMVYPNWIRIKDYIEFFLSKERIEEEES